jgi:hypothetical protein
MPRAGKGVHKDALWQSADIRGIVWWVMERLEWGTRASGKGPSHTECCATGARACVGLNRTWSETDAGPSLHFSRNL